MSIWTSEEMYAIYSKLNSMDVDSQNGWRYVSAETADAVAHDMTAAATSSQRYDLTDLLVTNGSDTVGTFVTILAYNGSTTETLAKGWAGPNGGFVLNLKRSLQPNGALMKLQFICGTAGANVVVTAGGTIASI